MSFPADELVPFLHRHDLFDLRPTGENLQCAVRTLVTDGANDGPGYAAHHVRAVAKSFDFLQHSSLVFLRNVGFENNDHGMWKQKNRRRISCGRASVKFSTAAFSAGG